MRYPCLILDHDDTVVQSETTINYPYFCYILNEFRPGARITLEEYIDGCSNMGFAEMCRQWYQFTEDELKQEYIGWKDFIRHHTPAPFPGIERIIQRQKASGGLICVVSHSGIENITRDYQAHFNMLPDAIYGWDLPEHMRKPNIYPLTDIMQRYHLKPEELLVVDDMKPAYEMASKAGVRIAFAGWGRKEYPQIYTEMEKLCDYTFDTCAKLEHFLFD